MKLLELAKEKVIVLDGGMGTGIQQYNPTVDDFGGLEGCSEILLETRPQWIREIHAGFFEAGCDVAETNSFGANGVVLAEYGIADRTEELSRTAAKLAREVAADFTDKPRYVLGSIGPGTRLPSLGHITYDALYEAFLPQAVGLLDGGVDALCIETCQDLLQVKTVIHAARAAMRKLSCQVPLFVSVTIESTGTMLVGSDIQAAIASLVPMGIDVLGLNCATGPSEMKRHVRHLSQYGPRHIMAMPNAGIPENVAGEVVYRLTPDRFADWLAGFVREDGVGIVGGCCGTTPAHLAALVREVAKLPAPQRQPAPAREAASLFQAVPMRQEPPPLLVGERTNANGSKEFRCYLEEDDLEGMLAVAREQEKGGAHLLDVCVAFVGRNEQQDMERFVPLLARNIRLPLVIDSTDPKVLEAALKRHGGRCIINSINLEDGAGRLDVVASLARKFGAGVIALAIDEQGMAMTTSRKLDVANRMFDLCVNRHGLSPADLVFDMLTFTVASGDAATRNAAVETLDAIEQFKQQQPEVHTILGVSNISFGLKPASRRVLNSVFLHLAVQRGLDQAIVNARGIIPIYRIEDGLAAAATRLLLNEKSGGDPLAAYMNLFAGAKQEKRCGSEQRDLPPEERLKEMVVDGVQKGLPDLLDLLQGKGHKPVDIINDHLIPAMKQVGELFGSGRMQLPFVLQSAETMKAAVGCLEPKMEKADLVSRGTLVLATVKGDVHDIGKNLAEIIVSNNGYTVVNLGIKVSIEEMLKSARAHNALAIGMSGLLVKSTVVMKENLEEMKRRGVDIPVLLGGAALNRAYVEGDLREVYGPDVIYCADAFAGLDALNRLVQRSRLNREPEKAPARSRQDAPAATPGDSGLGPMPDVDRTSAIPEPPFFGTRLIQMPLAEVFEEINQLTLFRGQWRYRRGKMSRQEYDEFVQGTVKPVFEQWKKTAAQEGLFDVKGVYGYFPCVSRGDDLVVLDESGNALTRFSFPRKTTPEHLCIADYFAPADSGVTDVVGMFVVTIGDKASREIARLYRENKFTDVLHLNGLAVETAQAGAGWLHAHMRGELGIHEQEKKRPQPGAEESYRGCRFSFGYPACPNLEDQERLFQLLDPSRIGVTLTTGFQMVPEHSVSALVVHHPQAKHFKL